jgi:UDP:flavonoid glycosyltransferase YjiC (YdhE family)
VHVTLGTVFNKRAKPLFEGLASGAASVAGSVVVTVGSDLDPDSFVGMPANVHLRRYLALGRLLERCDAVLAHGGWGTLVACAEAGLPMGALVLGADQGYNALILERGGWGFGIQPQTCTPDAVAEWTHRLLTDAGLRAGAKRQQAALREVPSPVDIASSLTERFG